MRKTEILPWTEEWETLYKSEEILLGNIVNDEMIGMYHIGSTSIPTIGYAKPIIDLLLVVRDIAKIDYYNEKMVSLGYNPRGENGIAGRRYFTKGKEKRTHHLHIYQEGNENSMIHLVFKKYLIMHPEDAKKYGELKMKLARQFPNDTHMYQEAKAFYVNELVKKAIKWSSGT
ncbi:GrpB family protein [Ferdinandcohnia sp. Marseille-Q9671]